MFIIHFVHSLCLFLLYLYVSQVPKLSLIIDKIRDQLTEQTKYALSLEDIKASLEEKQLDLKQDLKTSEALRETTVRNIEKNCSKLRKRLIVKSLWFRTQLLKMERIVKLAAQMDVFLMPELTCPQCVEVFKFPQTLHPCGHTMCGKCITEFKNDQNNKSGNMVCFECKQQSTSQIPNHTIDGILSRYDWWQVVLLDCRSQLHLTAEAEAKTKNKTTQNAMLS